MFFFCFCGLTPPRTVRTASTSFYLLLMSCRSSKSTKVLLADIITCGQVHHCCPAHLGGLCLHGSAWPPYHSASFSDHVADPLKDPPTPNPSLQPELSPGPMEQTAATRPSDGRRSVTKTACLENITAGRSSMKTTACCQVTGAFLTGRGLQ